MTVYSNWKKKKVPIMCLAIPLVDIKYWQNKQNKQQVAEKE